MVRWAECRAARSCSRLGRQPGRVVCRRNRVGPTVDWAGHTGHDGRVTPPRVGSGPDREVAATGEAPAEAQGILKPAQDGAQAVCEVGQQHEATGLEDLSQQVHGAVSQPS